MSYVARKYIPGILIRTSIFVKACISMRYSRNLKKKSTKKLMFSEETESILGIRYTI